MVKIRYNTKQYKIYGVFIMDVGKYIKMMRLKKGISQEELGKIVGVQRAAVQKWESGMTQNLKRSTIQQLADYFGVNPVSFIGSFDVSAENDLSFTDNEITLINKYRQLTSLGKEKVIDYTNLVYSSEQKDK